MTRAIKWTDEMISQAVAMRAEGAGSMAIGSRLGISKTTVADYIARHWRMFHPQASDPGGGGGKPVRRHYIGNERWVERVAYTTISGAVVSLPRVSILNGVANQHRE